MCFRARRLDTVDKFKQTVLHLAALNRQVDTVKLLLELGMPVAATNMFNQTALEAAWVYVRQAGDDNNGASAQHLEIVELLKAAQPDHRELPGILETGSSFF